MGFGAGSRTPSVSETEKPPGSPVVDWRRNRDPAAGSATRQRRPHRTAGPTGRWHHPCL